MRRCSRGVLYLAIDEKDAAVLFMLINLSNMRQTCVKRTCCTASTELRCNLPPIPVLIMNHYRSQERRKVKETVFLDMHHEM